ncbi:MAG: serpin family protein [Micavibrio sp.]|nr:serpin family protein [Micavibrio sp.]
MKKIIAFALLAAGIFSATAACAGDAAPKAVTFNDVTLKMTIAALSHQDDPADNLIISPYNAATAMTLVATGAAGNTKNEFAKALFGNDGDKMAANASAVSVANRLLADSAKDSVELLTASGIWVNKNIATLKDDYAASARRDFGAEISPEDFNDTTVPAKINKWASDNTKGLVDNVIDSLDNNDAIVLSSSLYFKGLWTSKFNKSLTADGDFTADGAQKFKTPMMHQNFTDAGLLKYASGDDYEAIAMTYGPADKRAARLILLRPKNAAESAHDWLVKQPTDAAPAWLDAASFAGVKGMVDLPHIDLKQKHDLIPVLEDMGIKDAFTGEADFSPMADVKGPGLYISRVSHDVVFKTDEDGSEAAAVTTITMRSLAMVQEPDPIHISFDRSFVFALQDVSSGSVLFIGVVNKPNAEMKAMTP